MNVMFTGQDRGGKNRRGGVAAERLDHEKAPKSAGRSVRTIHIFRGWRRRDGRVDPAGGVIRIGKPGRSIPGNVDPAIVPRSHPRENIIVQGADGRSRGVHREWSGPGIPLIRRVGVFQHGVADHVPICIQRSLLPNGVKISCLVDRHGRKISTRPDVRTEILDQKIRAIQAAGITDIGRGDTKIHRETTPHANLIQSGVIMDYVDVLDRGRQRGEPAQPRLTRGSGDRTDFVVPHDSLIATAHWSDMIRGPKRDTGRGSHSSGRRAVYDEHIVSWNRGPGTNHISRTDFIIGQIKRATIGRIAVHSIPLTINHRIRNADVVAGEREGRPEIIGPRRAEVGQS